MSPPRPHGPKHFSRPRSTALRRSAPSARRITLVSHTHTVARIRTHQLATCGPDQLGALVQSAQRETSRGERRPAGRSSAAATSHD
eukprot:scaffold10941_cov81-Phaeocystis_antarctica.AAC.5